MILTSSFMALSLMMAPVHAAYASGWQSKDQQTIDWRRAMLAALTSIDAHLQELTAAVKDQEKKPPKKQKN